MTFCVKNYFDKSTKSAQADTKTTSMKEYFIQYARCGIRCDLQLELCTVQLRFKVRYCRTRFVLKPKCTPMHTKGHQFCCISVKSSSGIVIVSLQSCTLSEGLWVLSTHTYTKKCMYRRSSAPRTCLYNRPFSPSAIATTRRLPVLSCGTPSTSSHKKSTTPEPESVCQSNLLAPSVKVDRCLSYALVTYANVKLRRAICQYRQSVGQRSSSANSNTSILQL